MTKKIPKRRGILALVMMGGVAGGCALLACSSSSPPLLTTDTTDASPIDTDAPSTQGTSPDDAMSTVVGQEGGSSGGDSGGAGAGDAEVTDATGGMEIPDVGYTLIDAASLPDSAGLDNWAPCDFLNCSPGCCTSTGACVPGTDPTACGAEGNACVDCTQTSQTCNPTTWECQ
jgi:hypothetical protein